MATNYFSGTKDLSEVFSPKSGTQSATTTGFRYNDNGTYKDLNQKFHPYVYGTKAAETKFISGVTDLNSKFQNITVPVSFYSSTTVTRSIDDNVQVTELVSQSLKPVLMFTLYDQLKQGTVRFDPIIAYTNVTIIIVGGGGGGSGDAVGGGGGGGGITILENFNINQGSIDIIVGKGGYGGGVSGAGVAGGNSRFATYISNGGEGGGAAFTRNGGNGGSINSIYGGGGGGGGPSGLPVSSGVWGSGGTGGSNLDSTKNGGNGNGVTQTSGGYNHGGSGGSSYYSQNSLQVNVPFDNISSFQLLAGGGGAGGGSGFYANPNERGGRSGSGVGGIYGASSGDGESSESGVRDGFGYFGNGGGGGAATLFGENGGGNGGGGCVLLYAN